MLKEISFTEAKAILKNGEAGGILYVYSDGTEAYADENSRLDDLWKHYDNGGKFAIEIEE